MIVLDTNVLSVLMHAKCPEPVTRWFKSQPSESLWITAITIFEASFGIEQVDDAKRRHALRTAFDAAVGDVLQGRILNFDAAAAYEAARLVADRRRRNRTVELRDTQIAGIVRARKATLATRNIRDFADAGIPLIDPWTAHA
jgi:predicted nucleic acid-binding protein